MGRAARAADAITTRDDGTTLDPTTEAEWADWVAAGATRNWCTRNELIDWLDLHGIERGFVPDAMRAGYDERLDFGRWVAEQGQRFEAVVLSHLAAQLALTRIALHRLRADTGRCGDDDGLRAAASLHAVLRHLGVEQLLRLAHRGDVRRVFPALPAHGHAWFSSGWSG